MYTILVVLATAFLNMSECSKNTESKEHVSCDRTFHKVGCFEESKGMTLLVNDRDPNSEHFQGYVIQWNKLGVSLLSLLCRCSQKARREGYTHISIRYYAECWASKRITTLSILKYGKPSNQCLQDQYQTCSQYGQQECGGANGSEYIYALITTIMSAGKDGDWSRWSKWTPCSSTCGEGETVRERSCTAPEPEGDGKNCEGPSAEAKQCHIAECPVVADSTGNTDCEKRIKGLYQAILYRNADAEGFKWHLENCIAGYSEHKSFEKIYESDERKERVCREEVDHLYKNILRIDNDASYANVFNYCFNNRGSYGALVKMIISRADFDYYEKTRYPTKCHKQTLGLFIGIYHVTDVKAVDDDEFEYYFEQCSNGLRVDDQIVTMMNSNRRQKIDCKIRVNHLYSDVLKRPGSEDEVKIQVNLCMNGKPFVYQVYGFIESPEFEELYRKIPPRVASITEI